MHTLRHRAQNGLGVGRGRLLDASGVVLDGCASIGEAGVQNGDSLTFQINIVQISCSSRYSEHSAFAAVLGDGSVATWRDREHGAESTAVQEPAAEC